MGATVIGAGLAGSEAAWQLAERKVPVKLIEMRPAHLTPAHKTGLFAELVCSNSLRGAALSNAVGLLKEELRLCNSLIMRAADAARVPAGGALAVDRQRFSQLVDEWVRGHPLVSVVTEEAKEIPLASAAEPVIVATGPLTSADLSADIQRLVGEQNLAFYDAISPIISRESVDENQVFRQSRYDKGDSADYLNIPMDRELYERFVTAVLAAEKFEPHLEDERGLEQLRPFEGCMPIEDMAARGIDTLRHGPFKPKGLRDPRTDRQPYAVLQLRFDNREETMCSMVGMQTRMKRPEQDRVFRMLPALAKAEFLRFGSVHRNTFINSPGCLEASLHCRHMTGLFFAGQMTGVEGYVESASGGLVAGINAARLSKGQELLCFPDCTAIGALHRYISSAERKAFQPMNINFGLMPAYLAVPRKDSRGQRIGREALRISVAQNSLATIQALGVCPANEVDT